jgi:hypothetical protein
MAVALSGHFTFPENGVLVSAVYCFSHDLGDKELRYPVIIEMQHCASANAVNGLCIVRADENSDAPYEFKVIPGGIFDHSDSYGVIELRHFCRIATFLWWRLKSLLSPLEYCAKLYYTNIEAGGFDYHLYIIPNLTMILRDIEVDIGRRDRKYEHGPITAIKLEDDKITLEIPEEAVCGWKMDALNSLQVNFTVAHYIIMLFQAYALCTDVHR